MKYLFQNHLFWIITTALFCHCSCSSSHCYVSSRIYPYSRKNLASYQIDTPDPMKVLLLPTQVIVIDWKLPHHSLTTPATYTIEAKIRFYDGSERNVSFPISLLYGKKQIDVTQEEYRDKGGIASYKIHLLENGMPISESRHKLWEEKVVITD